MDKENVMIGAAAVADKDGDNERRGIGLTGLMETEEWKGHQSMDKVLVAMTP